MLKLIWLFFCGNGVVYTIPLQAGHITAMRCTHTHYLKYITCSDLSKR